MNEREKDQKVIEQRREYASLNSVLEIDMTECGGYNIRTGKFEGK